MKKTVFSILVPALASFVTVVVVLSTGVPSTHKSVGIDLEPPNEVVKADTMHVVASDSLVFESRYATYYTAPDTSVQFSAQEPFYPLTIRCGGYPVACAFRDSNSVWNWSVADTVGAWEAAKYVLEQVAEEVADGRR